MRWRKKSDRRLLRAVGDRRVPLLGSRLLGLEVDLDQREWFLTWLSGRVPIPNLPRRRRPRRSQSSARRCRSSMLRTARCSMILLGILRGGKKKLAGVDDGPEAEDGAKVGVRL